MLTPMPCNNCPVEILLRQFFTPTVKRLLADSSLFAQMIGLRFLSPHEYALRTIKNTIWNNTYGAANFVAKCLHVCILETDLNATIQ